MGGILDGPEYQFSDPIQLQLEANFNHHQDYLIKWFNKIKLFTMSHHTSVFVNRIANRSALY